MQALLADPAALYLVLDPRAQQVLANPADLPTITIPVLVHRERRATGADGDRLFVREEVTTLDPETRQEIPGFGKTAVDLVIDQKSRTYLPGTEGNRVGGWGLPFNVKRGRSYSAWVSDAQRPLDAQYQGSENMAGLETYKHLVAVSGLPLGIQDPATSLPLVFDASITTWSEPRTGSTVRFDDFDGVYALHPSGAKFPRFVVAVSSTEESVRRLVDAARADRNKLVWYGDYLPWVSIGLGIALALAGAAALAWSVLWNSPRPASRGSQADFLAAPSGRGLRPSK